MEAVIQDLSQVIKTFTPKLKAINDAEFSSKPRPEKWSKKEVIGHLIDSAQNNLRRFIAGQYEDTPRIIYEQDIWVSANRYQHTPGNNVIELWRLINEQICSVLTSMPPANYQKNCNTGKQEPNLHTLEWLAADYVKHLKHHLNQVIPGSFDIKYP